ncbi:hypothetical protein C823_001304 [Eubacterium plexicaudatum ASF492]|uniref:DUF5050 domain-containing protein n=1 Tax=Eubacterium plexicaudatum ASF492 TaxID=1235802 RepID=N2B637_9FIRM|nr:hypothetical protein C823_001304 [Eubacterium plexicaudatum ASF492]
MNKKKKLVKILLIFALAVFVCGCSKSTDEKVETQKEQKADFSEKEKSKEADTETKEDSIEESIVSEENIDAYQNSSSENDTDLGLKNMKVDYAQGELSEEQKQIIEYFSRDYMFVNSGEALQRYNNIFDHALIRCYVNVIKVISYEGNDYELLVSIMENSNETDDQLLNESRYMIIKGATQESRFIQGDFLLIEGRYNGVVQETVDGISLTVPEIAVHGGYVLQEDDGWYFYPSRFSMLEVKNIAKSVFGEDITISEPDPNVDPVDSEMPYYVCTLDNQSNAKFSRYYFNEREGSITDAEHGYQIEFAADFQHFFLVMYDYSLETLTLEYYDNNLNKIWKREFEATTSASYDFTKNNVYLCANNELYILNIENGEDTYDSSYVGNKLDIRKFNDGILLVSAEKSDAFLYTDLSGQIVWKVDAKEKISLISTIQEVDGKLIIQVVNNENMEYNEFEGELTGSNEYYYVIDRQDGTLIHEGTVDSVEFHQYS